MSKLTMLVELEYDGDMMHGTDAESIDWFRNDILLGKCGEPLILHSNEIGDEVGTIRVLEIMP